MIDWYFVTVHSLWILGLAIGLAAFSWHDWERRERGQSLKEQYRSPSFQLSLSGGLLLVAVSFVLMKNGRWWERGVWAALGVSFAWTAWEAYHASRGGREAAHYAMHSSYMKVSGLPRVLASVELPIILAIAPALLLPTPRRLLVLSVVPVLWVCARLTYGSLVPRTAMNGPLWLLLATVGMSMFATVDILFSLGKVASVVLSALLFWAITRWMTTTERLRDGTAAFLLAGAGLAGLALLGTDWKNRFPLLDSVIVLLPTVIRGLPGAEEGFNPNPVAGCLVLFIPLQVAFLAVSRDHSLWTGSSGRFSGRWCVALQIITLLLTTGTFVLMQSRGAWSGLLVAAVAFLVWHGRRTRVLTAIGAATIAVVVTAGPWKALSLVIDQPAGGMTEGVSERAELWANALTAIQDVPLTGMGMNGFRRVMPVLYPTVLSTELDVAHAHNQLLQTALDVGLVGLVAYLSVWLVAAALLVRVYRRSGNPLHRAMASGLGAGLIAHFVFGIADAVALGTKVGVLFWLTLALTVGLNRVSLSRATG